MGEDAADGGGQLSRGTAGEGARDDADVADGGKEEVLGGGAAGVGVGVQGSPGGQSATAALMLGSTGRRAPKIAPTVPLGPPAFAADGSESASTSSVPGSKSLSFARPRPLVLLRGPAGPSLRESQMGVAATESRAELFELDPGKEDVVQLGSIKGKAGTNSTVVVSLPMPTDCRAKLQTTLECAVAGVRVEAVRAVAANVEVTLALECPKSGESTIRLRCIGAGRSVVGCGRIIIEHADPIDISMSAVLGSKATADVPIPEVLWQDKQYLAYFSPRAADLSVSCDKGVVKAGTHSFPFKLVFAPRTTQPVNTLLLVDLGDAEVAVRVRCNVGGFGGRRPWGGA